MKKFLIIIIIVFGILLFHKDENYISKDSIRFRVIANSNSVMDIMMKKLVVSELSTILFKDNDIDSTRKNILQNIAIIDNKIEELFKKNNYDMNFNILYGMNEFPKKEYNGIVYDEGLYESLVVEIGEAKGDNYWCFLYPSLCMIELDNEVEYKSGIVEFINDLFNVNNF